jgi:hypothetical protein
MILIGLLKKKTSQKNSKANAENGDGKGKIG